jgi:F-type H+-transporting ATPase subunit epsilon
MDPTVPHIVGVYLISHGLTHPDFQLPSASCQLSSTLTAMSTATWRQFFTYHPLHLPDLLWRPDCTKKHHRYNKYTQIAARAVRQSLKEDERVVAEKRGLTALKYQHWENGKGGEQVAFLCSLQLQWVG